MDSKLMLLVAFAAGAFAGPINSRGARDPAACASQCVDSNKFRYAPGSTYQYRYEATTRTTMAGAAEDHASLQVTADVDIEVMSKCEMILTMSGVTVKRSDPNNPSYMRIGDNSGDFQQTLEAYPLRFAFQDGIVEDVCPEEEESTWALNIKRAALSAFQNSMTDLERDQRLKERDVTGECFTDYRVTQRGWNSATIKKNKDLQSCEHRHGFRTAFHAMPYKVPNALHSLPLLKSTHDCSHVVRDGLLTQSSCSETHVFRPFSKDNNGAVTESANTLEYKNTLPYTRNVLGRVASRSGILFEHAYGLRDEEVNRHDASTKLQTLCHVTEKDIRPDVPEMFSELVTTLKNANYRSLETLYRQLQRGQLCATNAKMGKKFFIDALPMVGSVDSLRMITELISSKSVDEAKSDKWLTSLAFIQHPTEEMIRQIEPLMTTYNPKKSKLLVAAMVNNFCQKTPSCAEVPIVDKIISSLERDISRGCAVNDKNEDEVLITLRAIGNIGHAERLALSLEPCYTRADNSIEVRVAALDAFRRLPCGADRNDAMELYRDSSEDSELRVAAYLVAMQCPVDTILNQVRETLAAEKANQVGSFVWSHLMNLKETSSPLKQNIRQILEDEQLSKEFDLDKRKYSRNYEGSMFFEKLNAGAMVESNVIWSSKSFVPRSAMVNLTVDLFGQSVNLFEIGGRVEGMENVMESFLNPGGKKKKSSSYEDSRAVRKDKMNRMKTSYGQEKDDLHASMFIRIFGNELRYMHFDANNWPLTKDKFNFLDWLIKMSKDHDYSFTNSMVLIDSSVVVPTCAGLPLNLTVNAASTVSMKAHGKVDLRNIAAAPRSMLLEGLIQPSGAVEVTGMMTVDAFVTKAGLKMVSTLHSSTSVKGRVELSRGQIFNMELDMPQDKMEIVDVKSRFYIIHDKDEREQGMIQENRKTKKVCSGNEVAKVTGVELCGEIGFPNASMVTEAPYFPFTGPVDFSLTLLKRDQHTGYKVVVKTIKTKDKIFGQLGFDTPSGRVERAISLDLAVNLKDKEMELGLLSPWKKATIKSSLVNSDDMKQLKGLVVVDEKDEYALDSKLKITKLGSKVTYLPKVELRSPKTQKAVKLVTGTIIRDGIDQVDVDIITTLFSDPAINIQGGYVNTKKEKSMKLLAFDIKKPKEQYHFNAKAVISSTSKRGGSTRVQPELLIKLPTREFINLKGSAEYRPQKAIKMDFNVKMDKLLKNQMRIKADLLRMENVKRKRFKYKANTLLASEFITVKMTSTIDRKKAGTVSSQFAVDYTLPKVKTNKVTLSSKLIDRSSKTSKKYNFNANFDVKRNPELNFLVEAGVSHNSRHSEVEVKFRHGENVQDKKNRSQELNVLAKVDHRIVNSRISASIDYSIRVTYPLKDINFRAKGHHSHDKRNLATGLSVAYAKKQNLEAAFKLRNRSQKLLNLEGSFTLTYPGRDISLVSNLTQKTRTRYLHVTNLKLQKSQKSTLVVRYETPTSKSYKLSSEAVLHGYEPVKFDGSANLNLKNLQVSGKVVRKSATYGVSASSVVNTKTSSGQWSLDLMCPVRHVIINAKGGKQGYKYSAEFDTMWDADRDSRQKVTGKIALVNQRGQNKRIGGSFEVTSPFPKVSKIAGEVDYSDQRKEFSVKGSATWGRKQLSTSFSLDKPFRVGNLGVSFVATTPFEGYETLEASILNKYNQKLISQVKGVLGPHNAQVVVNVDHAITKLRRDIEAGIEFKSSLRNYRIVSLSMLHHDDGITFKSGAKYNDNGDIYKADFDASVINTKINFNCRQKLILTTPQRRITASLQHEHRPYAFKTVFETDWENGKKIVLDVNALYENVLVTKVNGGVLVRTPWDPVRDVDVNVVFEHGDGYMKANSYAKKDRRTLGLLESNYRRNHGQAEFDISLTGALLEEDIIGKVNANYQGSPLRGHGELQWASTKKVSMDLYIKDLQPKEFNIESQLRVTTPWKGAEDILIKYSNGKRKEVWQSKTSVNFGINQFISFESRIGYESKKEFRITVDSSFREMRHFDTGIEWSGRLKNMRASADIEIRPVMKKLAGEINWTLRGSKDLNGKLRIDTPFNKFKYLLVTVSHKDEQAGSKGTFTVEYHPTKVIELETLYNVNTVTDFTASASMKTPYAKYRKFEASMSLRKPTLEVEGHAVEGSMNLKTPFEKVRDINAMFSHVITKYNIQTHNEISYGLGKTLESDLFVSWENGIHATYTTRTPYPGLENIRVSMDHQGKTWKDFSSQGEVSWDGKRIDADVSFNHGKKTEGSLVVRTPFPGFEMIRAEMNREGNLHDFKTTGSVSYGAKPKVYETALQHVFKKDRFAIATSLKTPYTEDMKLVYKMDGRFPSLSSEGLIAFGPDYKLDTEFTLRLNNSGHDVAVVTSVDYLWEGKGRDIGITLVKQGIPENFNVEVGGKYNKKVLHAVGSFQKGTTSRGNFRLTTPFEKYTSTGVEFDHTSLDNRCVTNIKLNYQDNKEYQSRLEYVRQGTKRVEVDVELRTPHRGHEEYKLAYKHSLRKETFVAEAEVSRGTSMFYSSDLNVDYTVPARGTLNIRTPHDGYRQISGTGTYEVRGTEHIVTGNVRAGKHGRILVDATMDTSGEPYIGEATINTPFQGYENMKVSFTHRGNTNDFRSTATIKAPKLENPIIGEATWSRRNEKSMEAMITLSGGIENMEDLRFVERVSVNGNEHTRHVEFGWQKNKVIVLDDSMTYTDVRGVEFSYDLSLTTPFSNLTALNFKLDHMHNGEKVAEKMMIEYNGKAFFDGDLDYSFANKHAGAINIREPRPMAMTFDGEFDVKQINSELFLNWNTDDIESNIRFETAFNDRTRNADVDTDFKVKVIHPVRIMGVEAVVKRLPYAMQNKALITWDQKIGNTFAYDIMWNNQNRRYRQVRDGSIKIVVPTRAVKVSGSFTNSSSVNTLDASVMWDADGDQSKQVGIKLENEDRSQTIKRSYFVHLPAIKKDYELETTLTRNQGSVIWDGTTTFSYSKDPRKTLTLATKLENTGQNRDKNYTVSVGINHPSTYTNIEMESHMGHSTTKCSGGVVMSYEARDRRKRNFVLRGEVDRRQKQIDILASSPLKRVQLMGELHGKKPYHVSLTNRYDSDKVVSTDVTVDTLAKTLNVAFAYNSENPRDVLHLSAGYVNDSAIRAEIYRITNLQRIPESELALRLNTSHILHTRITWRPAAISEVQQFVASKVQVYSYIMNEAFSEISQAMGQEVTTKYNVIANEINTDVEPIFTYLGQELGHAKVNLNFLHREMRRAYQRNDLFIRDIGEALNSATPFLVGDLRNVVVSFNQFKARTERTLAQWMQMVKNYPIAQKYVQFIDQLINSLKHGQKVSEANMRLWAQKLDRISMELYKFYLTHTRRLQRKMRAFVDSIMSHPQLRMLKQQYDNLQAQMSNLPNMNLAQASQMLDQAIQNSLEPVKLKDSYNQVMGSTKQALRKQMNAIRNNKHFQKVHGVANEIYQQLLWAYKYWDLDTNLRVTLLRLYTSSRDVLFMELNKIKDTLVDLDKSRIIVYDPINGELQLELYLPVPLKSLTEAPEFKFQRYIRKIQDFRDRYIPKANYSVWDTYYKFVPSLDSSTWLPPYRAYAAVVGNQHFITFDNTHFDFAGRCSYVLTRDMVDDNFTVVLNYDNNVRAPRKKSLLVMLRGASIEIANDYKVTVNDRPVELPYTVNNIEAVRQNHQISIDDGSGLTVEVDPEHDLYTIGLSGWYHGRTAGLLGTFDNEKSNDMMSSTHQILTDINVFASSWEVGRRSCRTSNKAVTINMADIEATHPICVSYFKSQSSHFRPCFSQVDPEEYLHTCVGYTQQGQTLERAACLTAGQYFHQCRTNGVYLEMPQQCVSCSLGGSMADVMGGDSVQISAENEETPLPSSADVILVLEEKSSKQWTPSALGDLVTDIDSTLRSTGIQRNQYGLVGYGGPGRLLEPHSHTFDGQLFTNAKGFLKGVENIAFSSSKTPADGLAAVRKATNYPFRTGVSKVLVFLPASDCEITDVHVDLDGLLQAHGFSMHIMRNTPVLVRNNKLLKNAQLFGMDRSQILTQKTRPARDQQILGSLIPPSDLCASLALNTNGSIFDTTHLTASNARVRRDFVRTFAKRVAHTAKPPQCQSCKCEQDEAGLGKTVCRPCDKTSFLWNYLPNWWSNNKTPVVIDDWGKQIRDYLQTPIRVSKAA